MPMKKIIRTVFNKDFWQKLCLIAGGLFFALILVELLLRLFWSPSIITDPFLAWRGHGKSFDANGFRNESVLSQADIVAMGDSMTYGDGSKIDQAWPQVLSKMSGKSVYQMAFGGYGPIQYNYLIADAVKMHPQVVIFGFYIGNDYYDVLRMVYRYDNWSYLRNNNYTFKNFIAPREAEGLNNLLSNHNNLVIDWLKKKTNWLTSRLYLNHFLSDIKTGWNNWRNQSDQFKLSSKLRDYLNNNPVVGYYYNQEPQETLLVPTNLVNLSEADLVEANRLTKILLLNSQAITKQKNIFLVIALIPTKELVYAGGLLKEGKSLPFFLNSIYTKELSIYDAAKKFCFEQNLSCVSTLEPLEDGFVQGKKIYHSTFDSHPNAEGYQLIAYTIFQYLEDLSLQN